MQNYSTIKCIIWFYISETDFAKMVDDELDWWHVCNFVENIQTNFTITIQTDSTKNYTKLILYIFETDL